MATTIITGGSLTLTVNAISRSEQVTSAILTVEQTRNPYNLIGGTKAYKVVDNNATLAVEFLLDWATGGATEFAEVLWNAASSAPDTALPFILSSNGQTFTGNIFPEYPSVGGAGNDVQSNTLTFQCSGIPTKA